ncbi:multiple monosaccharide ABC transporter substrate-binding protein [Pengzhenrongella sicca]|uniref:Sugar-binding protein n=1 Tax=Pengzhenrongella sicca TaxID=2819238 RepID=A0A8A4ZK15_9MICO|nr:multiple monosaccharide ABC transporter substrate-binding protein [Pengzhenrongella sicca]QTE29938.1 sugar-binding protein [Pengzhenrongella sicca]
MRHVTTRRAVAAALALATTTALAGCAGAPGETGAQLVGVAMPTTTSDRWIADGDNVSAQLEALGHSVDLEYAEDDVPTQISQIEAMISAGADVLIVAAIDGTKLTDVLAEAAAADIPVISYDRLIRDSPDVDYYATFDNARVGVQQATTLLQGLGVLDAGGAPTGAAGPFAVELFAGSPDDNNATVFYDGAMSVLQPYLDSGVLVVPSGQTDFATIATQGWSGETAATRMATLLPAYDGTGLRLAGILSPYDGISIALLEATAGIGYGTDAQPWPAVTGQDAEVGSIKSIIAGEQFATVYKDTRQLAEVTVSMVEAVLNDDEPQTNDVTSYDNGVVTVPAYLLTSQVVTKSNYQQVLVDSGYYTVEDLG